MQIETSATHDVIIGGGPAGLSAAVALARFRRSVAVVDAEEQRNLPASGIHNFLTREGISPTEFLAAGRAEAAGFGARFVDGSVATIRRSDAGFRVELADGSVLAVRRVLVATGLVDELPEIDGLRERWGRDVIHCPYCHGWEVRGRKIGIIATGPGALVQAQMFRQLTDDLTVFTNGVKFTADDLEPLNARAIKVIDGVVHSLRIADDRLAGVVFAEGGTAPAETIVIGAPVRARADVLSALGLVTSPHPQGDWVESEPSGATVDGVWLAGNVTDASATVVSAAAAGLAAAAALNNDLLAEEVTEALRAYRAS
ncbi:NAD(P)/FAD-dependent oxidoreductase [soil metagenome]